MRARRPPRGEDALARVVLDRYLAVRRGESVTIETWNHALPWARAFVVEARHRGAVPTLVLEDESAFFHSVELGGSATVKGTPAGTRGGAYVYFGGPEEFPRLLGLPANDLESLIERHDRAWWEAARSHHIRAVRLAISDATLPAAARYGVDLAAWQAELLHASLVDPDHIARIARGFTRALGHAGSLRIRHPNGTDLELRRGSSPLVVESGRPDPASGGVWGRVPSGLLVVPLRAGVAEGVWESNRPAFDRFVRPPLAVGGRFKFRAGRLTEFAFDHGGEPFAAFYARAGRGRERPAALTIGLNPAVSHAPEVLEFGAGTLGLLLGDSPYLRGTHRARFSYLAALAGADVEVDGRPWMVGGLLRTKGRR
jgi:leucyl aminopeptidase (aminopeptidase T)